MLYYVTRRARTICNNTHRIMYHYYYYKFIIIIIYKAVIVVVHSIRVYVCVCVVGNDPAAAVGPVGR